MTKEQEIAMLNVAISLIEHHYTCIEGYTKHMFMKYIVKKGENASIKGFFESIPEECLILRSEIKMEEPYKSLYQKCRDRLAELTKKPKK